MKIKKSNILYYITIIALSIVFVFLYQISFAQTYVPITNYHNGISIGIQGTQGSDYVFDRYYFDPLINDCGLCYIKSDVDIELSHNSNNSRAMEQNTVIIGGDFGDIRYKIDMDWKNDIKWAGTGTCYPLYPGPLSFEDMEYEPGVPVVGTIGFKSGASPSDRSEYYGRGMLDAVGNEYHYMTYADDDDAEPDWKNLEMSASDGKSMLFCVNPKTPAIWLGATNSSAQYYTTPAKVYWVPKVFEQTSYVTDDVEIQLKNIMNSNTVYYRIDGGSYQAYSGAITSNTLSDGEHTLEFYYDPSYVQTRKIVKNPDHPSKQDVFEDGSGHGYLLWKNEADFLRFKDRMLNGVWSNSDYYFRSYYQYKSDFLDDDLGYVGNEGIRNNGPSGDMMYAVVGILEGISENIDYMRTAKTLLMNNERMHIECIGWEGSHTQDPIPSKEINYRGYYDDAQLFNNAFTYDLLVAHFRSDQHPEGITPIEDLRLRDMIVLPVHEGMMYHGGYWNFTEYDVDNIPMENMWPTAHQNAAVVAALAMPAYNTNYYGTAGFDGTTATHAWTPYPDHPETWKDVFLTYTDKDNSGHVSRLHPFPNRKTMFNWYDGTVDRGLVRADGNWHDRIPYCREYQMGHGIEYFYNVMKRKFNITYPALDLFMEKSIDGTLYCYKDEGYANYPRRNMANEYFPDLAPIVIDFDPDDKYFYMIKPYYHFFHNPNYADDITTCESPNPPSVPANLSGTPGETTVALSWSASTPPEDCMVSGYKIERNGTQIALVSGGTQYTDAGLISGVQYSYSVASMSDGGVTSAFSSEIQVTTLTDQIAPQIQLVSNVSLTSVSVKFDEPVDPTTAATASNYSLNNGISIASAQLLGDNLTVGLVVSTLTPGTQYTVTVNNVEDLAGNVIVSNSTASFTALDVQTNIALNMPVTVSVQQAPDNIGDKLVDGNTGDDSRWAAEPMPQWAEIDLGTDYDLTSIEVYTYLGRAYQYTIEAKPDGGNYAIIIDRTANTDASPIIDVVSNTARYIKINVTGAADYTGTWASINEIQVYGSLAASGPISVTGISVSPTTLTLDEGQTADLTETVFPSDATYKSVTWSSSNGAIATVDANGLVTAVADGNCTITVTSNDDNQISASCAVTVNDVPPPTGGYYCDPVSGSMSNDGSQSSPWSSLEDVFNAGKTFVAGDVINLLSGYHGSVTITGNNSDHVTIQAAPGAQPELKDIDFTNASYWTINGLEISPDLAPEPIIDLGSLISIDSGSSNIIVDNCEMYTIDDNTVWGASDWVSLSSNGMNINGDNCIIRNCTVRNIDMGIFVDSEGNNNLVEYNLIKDFSGDGMRGIGNYNTFQYNIVQDNYNVDDNHDDGFQSYSIGAGGAGTGVVYGIVLRGNTIINVTDPTRPFQGPLQGIGNFDGMFEDWVVENNVIFSNHYNGLTFLGATNCKIINNTVVDMNDVDPGPLWIQIAAHKDGTPSTGNIVRNNITTDLNNDANIGTVDHNIVISHSELNAYFTDPGNFDLSLKSSSPAIDAGSATDAPSIDIIGNTRPQGAAYDVGAYEYSGAIIPVTGVTVSPTTLTLNVEESTTLVPSIIPSDASNISVTWSSSNESVAFVDDSGVVTGVLGGTATISVATVDGGYTDECTVTVNSPQGDYNLALFKTVTATAEQLPDNAASNLVNANTSDDSRWSAEGMPQSAEIDLGIDCDIVSFDVFTFMSRAYQYTIEAKADGGSYATVVDRSSNTSVNQPITDAVTTTARYVKITVTGAAVYTGTWASINELRVVGRPALGLIAVTGVSVSPTSLSLDEGQTADLTDTVSPSDATDKSVTWNTSDDAVATVDANGLVTAVSAGNATITVTTNDGGYTANCNVTVSTIPGTTTLIEAEDYNSTSGCSIDSQHSGFTGTGFVDYGGEGTYAEWTNIDGGSGGTASLTVRYANGGSTSRPCDVEVNGQVVGAITLSPTGDWTNWVTEAIDINLNAGSVNTIRITANSSAGGPNLDNLEVTTSGSGCNPVTTVSLNNTSAALEVSETLSLAATVLPLDACDNSVAWNSSDNAVATVDANGLVTAISTGNATITVSTNDGGYTADCYVTVNSTGIETNLALGKPVTVSDEETPDNIGSNLVDDNTEDASRWAAAYFPQWAEIDLGEDCNLTRMEVNPYLDRDYQYIIEVSSDGINYTTAVDRSSNAESANALIDNVSVTGRFVRITVSGANTYTGSWVSLTEVMVFGTSGSSIINVTGVSVSTASLNLDEGQTSDLTETISPVNATDQTVTWSSNNPSIATVNNSGVVTAISAGSATITVTTNDGGFSDQCAVTVSPGGTEVNLALGKSVTVSDEETPDNIGNKLVDDNTEDASRWAAAYFPQWAEIDLGVNCDLTRMEVYPYQDRDYQYIIEAKPDGGSYTTVVDRSSNTEGADALINNVSVNARYVKITVSGAYSYTGPWASLAEVKVFGYQGGVSKSITLSRSATVDANSLDEISVNLYPNPVNGNRFNIELNGFNTKQTVLEVIDISGKKVYRTQATSNIISVNKQFAKGVYILNVNDGINDNRQMFIVN